MRCNRGYTEQLPDLAVWLEQSTTPGGGDRRKWWAPRGSPEDDPRRLARRRLVWPLPRVRYDCTSPSVTRWITRLAKKVGLTDTDFTAAVQTTAEQIAALPPAAPAGPSRRGHRHRRDRRPTNRRRRPARRPTPHLRKRPHRRNRCNSRRPSRRRHRSPRRPRPPRSASVATARSSAWTKPSPGADGAADAQLEIRPDVAALRALGHPPLQQPNDSNEERARAQRVRREPRDQDRRLAPAPAIDLAALGKDHATGLGA
jgi:hypothetical protein